LSRSASHAAWSLAVLLLLGVGVTPVQAAGSLVISEFRLRGLTGAEDEFIEIYNDSNVPHSVAPIFGAGYAIAASDGVVRCTIPTATVIPARGHWLCVNSAGYALGAYPAGSGTTATGDGTYTLDIPDNAGIALFNNDSGGGFILANRFDAVGSTSEANTLYKEGTGYPALTSDNGNYAWVRDECGKTGDTLRFGFCTITTPADTDNNANDFFIVDTSSTSLGGGLRLGAPGPQNLSSPIQRNSTLAGVLVDSTLASSALPNRARDLTSDPANNSTFGTLSIRRRFVNNTGAPVTRLRFRIIDLSAFPVSSVPPVADLRPRTSGVVPSVAINDPATCAAAGQTAPCVITIEGTMLEQAALPSHQYNGGAFNSSMGVGSVSIGTPLPAGASVNVQFLLGLQSTGNFRFYVNIEALP
jgi:hypothetical protein